MRPSVEERFWSKVKGGDVLTCWEWTGSRTELGYGRFYASVGGKSRKLAAHRVAFHLMRADILDNPTMHLDHLCSNPPCVNPWHLDVVDWQANTLRAIERGRWRTVYTSPDQVRPSAHGASQYHRVFEVVKGQIQRGELAADDPILTEVGIRQRYRTTTVGARGVMAWLKAEGLVVTGTVAE